MEETEEAYNEGYKAYLDGNAETSNPYPTGYVGALGEYWSDGYEDAMDDEAQSRNHECTASRLPLC